MILASMIGPVKRDDDLDEDRRAVAVKLTVDAIGTA